MDSSWGRPPTQGALGGPDNGRHDGELPLGAPSQQVTHWEVLVGGWGGLEGRWVPLAFPWGLSQGTAQQT